MRVTAALIATVFLVTGLAGAGTVTPYDAGDDDFIAGDGIPANNFEIDTGTNGESVAIKARGRDTGQPLSISGINYYVSPGNATTDPTSPWFVFDFQFSPGTSPASNYDLVLEVDFDSTAGTDFATLDFPMFDTGSETSSWSDGDGYFTNPGSGGWTSGDVPYVYSQSWHMDYDFWSTYYGKTYDANALGEYTLRFSVYDLDHGSTDNPLASVEINAVVVPVPAAAGLSALFLGALGGIRVLRRRRRG